MKKLRTITLITILSCITFLLSSCLVGLHRDNGYHRGFYKSNHHHNQKVYVVKPEYNKKSHSKSSKESHKENNKKNYWNAKK